MLTWIKRSLFIFFLILAQVAIADDDQPMIDPPSQKPQYLFVMRAEKASILKVGAGYLLILKNIEDKTLYFSDRPLRQAGLIATDKFMDLWEEKGSSFSVTPPNAALIHDQSPLDTKGISPAVAVELSHPHAEGPNSWQFNLSILEGDLTTGEYKNISIFIDDFSGSLLKL